MAASAWEPISPDSSAANADEDERAVGPYAASDERLGRGQHRRGARRVVLGPVVDRVAVHRRADTEVVVVAPDQHRFARMGPPAGQAAQHVVGLGAPDGASHRGTEPRPSGTALKPGARPRGELAQVLAAGL